MTSSNYVRASALISDCKRYRWTLTRVWDNSLPVLLVVMFNPSTADGQVDDPTIKLLVWIAAHNGYGGIRVVNLIPLRSSKPAAAIEMVTTFDKRGARDERDALMANNTLIRAEAAKAGAVLLAWGALAGRLNGWSDAVIEEIEAEIGDDKALYCLGRTAGGYPIHPMARGKLKLPKNAPLIPWAGVAA